MVAEHLISVPGRLCLTGEHSDWAADYRLQNSTLTAGAALVVGLQQAITARTSEHSTAVVLDSALAGKAKIALSETLSYARHATNTWRFAAAVAYLVHDRFTHVRGLCLHVVKSTLPAQKGFSSSAAISVLVARAYNRVYALNLTPAAEMDLAYAAERLTGSACGRMDQIVAIGSSNVARMLFDVDFVRFDLVTPVSHGKPVIQIVVADLGRSKDTAVILSSLQKAYPEAHGQAAETLRDYLGSRNLFFVDQMQKALTNGDSEQLGSLMTQAQSEFDAAATPFCPEELTAPHLHSILNDPDVKPLIFGGKGVGSQGDGAVQFVAIDEQSAKDLVQLLKQKLCTEPVIVTPWHAASEINGDVNVGAVRIQRPMREGNGLVRRAIIPTAGYGTRLFPASRSVRPKSLMPIVDEDGFTKPILLHLVEQTVKAGISDITIVAAPGPQEVAVRDVFLPVGPGLGNRLKPHMLEYAKKIEALGQFVKVALQEDAEGFGHAVSCGIQPGWEEEPFVVLLGDVVFKCGANERSAVEEVVSAFEEGGGKKSVIGVSGMAAEVATSYGVVKVDGSLPGAGQTMEIAGMLEKPSAQKARSLADEHGECNVILGPYVFTSGVMNALVDVVKHDLREGSEIQLTTAMRMSLGQEGMSALRLRADALDTGTPAEYADTFSRLRVPEFPT